MLHILTQGGVQTYTVLCDAIESMSPFYKSDCDGMRQLLTEPAPGMSLGIFEFQSLFTWNSEHLTAVVIS